MSKILLVGDDYEGLERLGAVLEGFGYDVESILESYDAESVLEEGPDFSMVVLQEQMPIFNGYELAERIRSNPYISTELTIILYVPRLPSYQKLEGVGISQVLRVDAEIHEILECVVRHLEQYV